jgi:hypothetical protein
MNGLRRAFWGSVNSRCLARRAYATLKYATRVGIARPIYVGEEAFRMAKR